MALQEIREIQMQPVKLSTSTRRGLDISDLDHNRFALGFKLAVYDLISLFSKISKKFASAARVRFTS